MVDLQYGHSFVVAGAGAGSSFLALNSFFITMNMEMAMIKQSMMVVKKVP